MVLGCVVETCSVASLYVASVTFAVVTVAVVELGTVSTTYDVQRSASTVQPETVSRCPTHHPCAVAVVRVAVLVESAMLVSVESERLTHVAPRFEHAWVGPMYAAACPMYSGIPPAPPRSVKVTKESN